jgi:hypothetical protein
LQFVLTLPDGSKSLVPADWTDFKANKPSVALLIGSPDDLLRLRDLVDALLRRATNLPVISGASQENHAATESELHRHPDSRDVPLGKLDDEQKRTVIETLTRLLVKATRDEHQEQTND